MEKEDFSQAIGRQVKDVYGRQLGKCIGFSVELDGSPRSIGVQAGPDFVEFPAAAVQSIEEEAVVVIPEWKIRSRSLGLDKGVFERRMSALNAMLRNGEISQRAYDEMTKGIAGMEQKQEQFIESLARRLKELDDLDGKIEMFLARVRLQGLSEELSEDAVRWTSDYCTAMKLMDGRERDEINEIMELVSKDSLPAELMRATEEADRLVQEAELQAQDEEGAPGQ